METWADLNLEQEVHDHAYGRTRMSRWAVKNRGEGRVVDYAVRHRLDSSFEVREYTIPACGEDMSSAEKAME
jgi:hypothetical protein